MSVTVTYLNSAESEFVMARDEVVKRSSNHLAMSLRSVSAFIQRSCNTEVVRSLSFAVSLLAYFNRIRFPSVSYSSSIAAGVFSLKMNMKSGV